MDWIEAQQIADTHVCAVCGSGLIIMAGRYGERYEVHCSRDRSHRGWIPIPSPGESYRRGEQMPLFIVDAIERRREKMQEEQKPRGKGEETKLPVIYEASTGKPAPVEEIARALEFAQELELNPRLGHVCLYYGKPWVTIDGWYYLFRRSFPKGQVVTRPLDPGERELQKIRDEELHAWKAECYDDQGALLSVGYGYAREGEEPLAKGSAVEPRWPWRLAEKRAEEDAIRKALGLGS